MLSDRGVMCVGSGLHHLNYQWTRPLWCLEYVWGISQTCGRFAYVQLNLKLLPLFYP